MHVTSIATGPVLPGDDLFALLDRSLPALHEGTVVAITSKVVSLCEGSVRKATEPSSKRDLIHRSADLYLDVDSGRPYSLTILRGILIPNAGIDESNANGYYVLWPENPVASAAAIWHHLKARDGLHKLGIVITDSHTTPGRWGSTGIGLAWCGFKPLTDYIGTPDIFGRRLEVTKRNVLDGLAASAAVVMGEGAEQTPAAVITDVAFVEFTETETTQKDADNLMIGLGEDLYAPILTSVPWKKRRT